MADRIRKIALEEHFMAPGFQNYSKAFTQLMGNAAQAELSAKLDDFHEIRIADMDRAGKENSHIGEITIGGRKIRGPLHIQPGLSNYTLVLPLGYGRTVSGHIGKNAGFLARCGAHCFEVTLTPTSSSSPSVQQ